MAYTKNKITTSANKKNNEFLRLKIENKYRDLQQCSGGILKYDDRFIEIDSIGEIAAIELRWVGMARFQNKCGKGWIPIMKNNRLLLFSMGKESLNPNILDYHGTINITKCIICNWDEENYDINIVRNIIDDWSTHTQSWSTADEEWSSKKRDYKPFINFRGNLI